MNAKTSKLIRRHSTVMSENYRKAKRKYQAMPKRERADFKTSMRLNIHEFAN